MSHSSQPVRWAPRVSRVQVRRLYQTDALGLVDEDLIDAVGFALYARCQSILTVTAAAAGRVECPVCAALVLRASADAGELLRCAACGWETTWAAYHRTWQHQGLYGGGAVDTFQAFAGAWPRATSPQQKMVLIDRLIHTWHWQTRQDHQLGRPTGVNLIEGSRAQVLALLDELTYGPASTTGLRDTHDTWRASWQQVRAMQHGDREGGTSE